MVGKSDSDIRGVFGNSSLDFVDGNNNKLRWLSVNEGLGASELSIGTPDVGGTSNLKKRWRIYTAPEGADDGAHLRFTRHT